VDVNERANGVLFRQVEFALPTELQARHQVELALEFSRKVAAAELPYTMAVHRGKGHNPHCHLLLSERLNDGYDRTSEAWFKRAAPVGKPPESGGARKADIGSKRKTWLAEIRETWASLANVALESAGHTARIDHRSLAEQGNGRLPQIHLGPNVVELEEKGIPTDRADHAFQIAKANNQIHELKLIEKEINDEGLGESRKSPEHASATRYPARPDTSSQSENRPAGEGGGSHEQSLEKAPPAAPARTKPIQPTTRPTMSESTTGGAKEMNLPPSEDQDFLRVKRLMAQRQEEEKQQRRFSEEQKKRIEEMILRTEEAALKRPDSLYWEDYFALDCMEELRKRKQTVEQADWREIEGKVVAGLLMDGVTVKDAAEILYEKGVGAALDPATPPDGQTAGEKQVMEYLKSFAAGNPDLMDAIEQAEERQKDEARDAQREQMRQIQAATPQRGA
jgi:hypothetical protein